MWAPRPCQIPALEQQRERRRAWLQHLGERQWAKRREPGTRFQGVCAWLAGKAAAFLGIWAAHPARFAGQDMEVSGRDYPRSQLGRVEPGCACALLWRCPHCGLCVTKDRKGLRAWGKCETRKRRS